MAEAAAMLDHMPFERGYKLAPYALTPLLASLVWLSAPTLVLAQANGCALSPGCDAEMTSQSGAPPTRAIA
jgi:hypothetical protein